VNHDISKNGYGLLTLKMKALILLKHG